MSRPGGFPVGYVFHENYRVVRRLGMGGMGVVFEVEHLRLPRRLALKVMTAPVTASSEYNMRFRREAEIAASINHSNLVSVFDWNVTPDERLPYLVMELLAGEDLAQVLKRSGALPRPVAISILAQAIAALEVVHSHGIVHRDIKPANLFLCKNSIIPHFTKLLDFGIAKSTQPSPGLVTNNLVLMGTPAYMAPEQARGDLGPVGPRADQFALAVVFYEMVSGHPAFYRAGEAAMSTLFRVMSEEPAPLPDPALDAAVRRALRKHPDERYPSLSAMLSAIVGASAVPLDEIAVPERTEKVVLRPVDLADAQLPMAGALADTHPPVPETAPPPTREASAVRPLRADAWPSRRPTVSASHVAPLASVILGSSGGAAVALVSSANSSSASPASSESAGSRGGTSTPATDSAPVEASLRRGWILLALLVSAALTPLGLSALLLRQQPPLPAPQRQRPVLPTPDLSEPQPDLASPGDVAPSDGGFCGPHANPADSGLPKACGPSPSDTLPTPPTPRPRRPTLYIVGQSGRNGAASLILDCIRKRLNDVEQWRLVNHSMQLVRGGDERFAIYDDYWINRPARYDLEYCFGSIDASKANLKIPIVVKGEDPKP